jgi:desulfoferrodoxin-like iron-binding protein
MALENERYRCEVCGQEVVVAVGGPGRLYCCGEPMVRVEEKNERGRLTTDDRR